MNQQFEEMALYLQSVQTLWAKELTNLAGDEFLVDSWQHGEIHGVSQVVEAGAVIEKAGIGFSRLTGDQLPAAATKRRPELVGCRFQGCGVSLIVHPRNPWVPTTHANFRCFVAKPHSGELLWWFGGGYDLTPYLVVESDYYHWHQITKQACDSHDPDIYALFKQQCDAYFYLPHRQEHRGIGGIFFDDLQLNQDWSLTSALIKSLTQAFLEAYLPIFAANKDQNYSKTEREFQLYRRGRYVEFNLIYDRGTLFGLQTKGRIQSIFMSLPSTANWHYSVPLDLQFLDTKLQPYLQPRSWL